MNIKMNIKMNTNVKMKVKKENISIRRKKINLSNNYYNFRDECA